MAKKKTKKIDKRTKAYKDSLKKKPVEAKKKESKEKAEVFKVVIPQDEDMALERLKMRINDHVPQPLIKEIKELVQCKCILDGYDRFMTVPFMVTVQMQRAINEAYYQFFKERLRTTSCSTCMKRRIKRIRKHLKPLIDG